MEATISPTLKMTIERQRSCVVVCLEGRMDGAAIREIQPEFESSTAGTLPVIVDLTRVHFMESLGVALLVRLAKRQRDALSRVAVVPGAGPVARLLGMARVDRILNVAFTREAAFLAVGA